MTLQEILAAKGIEVFTTPPEATLQQVIQLLVEHNVGSLVVVESEGSSTLVGIITERDLLKASAAGHTFEDTRVADVMTTEVHTGCANNSITATMGLMTDKHIRHLPIIEDGHLAGMISIGDVVKAEYNILAAENKHLKEYIQS